MATGRWAPIKSLYSPKLGATVSRKTCTAGKPPRVFAAGKVQLAQPGRLSYCNC